MGMSEENEPKEIEPKGSRILFCYFVVVLLLGLVAVGILFRAFDTAFVERDKWMKVAESQKRPNRLVLPGRGNIYSSDGKLMATSVPRYYMYIDFKADAYTPAKDAKYNWLDTFKTSKKDGVDSLAFYLSRKLKDRTPAGYKAYLLKGLSGKSRQFPIYAGKVSYSDLKEIRKFPFLRLGRYKSGFIRRRWCSARNLSGPWRLVRSVISTERSRRVELRRGRMDWSCNTIRSCGGRPG